MTKKIATYTPIKDPNAPNMVVWELLFEPIVKELHELLSDNNDFEVHQNLDIRNAVVKNGKVFVDDVCVSDFDLFFWYFLPAYETGSFDITVLKTLARHTTVVPDPFALEKTMDKFTAHSVLRHENIPVAEYALFSSADPERAGDLFDEWGGPLLLKPTLGRFGHGIVKADNRQSFLDAIGYAASFHDKPIPIFVERFQENDIAKWISATVIGDEVVFGYRKRPKKFVDGWKVYDAGFKGGEADYVDPAPVADIALAAKRALGADVVGFDCIYSTAKKQYVIVDENTFPGVYEECFKASGKGTLAENFYRLILQRSKS